MPKKIDIIVGMLAHLKYHVDSWEEIERDYSHARAAIELLRDTFRKMEDEDKPIHISLSLFQHLKGQEKHHKCEWSWKGKRCGNEGFVRVSVDRFQLGIAGDAWACSRCFNYLIKEHHLGLTTEKKAKPVDE